MVSGSRGDRTYCTLIQGEVEDEIISEVHRNASGKRDDDETQITRELDSSGTSAHRNRADRRVEDIEEDAMDPRADVEDNVSVGSRRDMEIDAVDGSAVDAGNEEFVVVGNQLDDEVQAGSPTGSTVSSVTSMSSSGFGDGDNGDDMYEDAGSFRRVNPSQRITSN